MRGSWKLAQVAGIGIYVHWTFLILIGWVVFVYLSRGAAPLAVAEGIAFIAAVFACIVAHELGHALTARHFGISTRDITLLPIGGVARLERMPEDPRQELLVALGGPAVTLLIAAALSAVVAPVWGLAATLDVSLIGGNFLAKLMWVNAILLAFNLLPAFPMDGGRVLRAALHFYLDYVQATQIAASVGQALAIFIGLGGLIAFNPFLLLIALFVYFGAREEARSVQIRSLCRAVPVRHAMVTQFTALDPDATLQEAVDALLAGEQQDFPIVDDRRLVGMLSRRDLLQALESGRGDARVDEIMRTDCEPVGDKEMLDDTFERMRGNGCSTVPVVRDGAVVGIITLENIGEWMMVQTALRRTRPRDQIDDIYRSG